jgi:hypothetical protein
MGKLWDWFRGIEPPQTPRSTRVLASRCELHINFHGSTQVTYWMQLRDGTRIDFLSDNGARAMMNGDTLIVRNLITEMTHE